MDTASDYENILMSHELDIIHVSKGENERVGIFSLNEAGDPRNDTGAVLMLNAAYKEL